MKRILIATDGSAGSHDAVELGLDLAGEHDATVFVVHVAELLPGNPIHEIVAFADANDVDLIVIGSRGHGAVGSAVLGSVSLGVLRETQRPVLIVRAASPAGERAPRRSRGVARVV